MPQPYYKQHWIDVEPERHAAYDKILGFHPALEPMLAALELPNSSDAATLRVLDVGAGPGHTTLEIARRAGSRGRVTGVDINSEFVRRATARAAAAGLGARVEFRACAFPPLPFGDLSFDRVWCKNVLEYVDSAADTVSEMARVAARGAVVVAIDSDWEMIALELGAAAQALNDRVIAAAQAIALKEPRIGRRLYGLFKAAGLSDVRVTIAAGADTVGRATPMLRASLARYALDSGQVGTEEVKRWLEEIDRAIKEGRFLFVLPQFLARASKG